MSTPEGFDNQSAPELARDLIDPELVDVYMRAELVNIEPDARIVYTAAEVMRLIRYAWWNGARKAMTEPDRIREIYLEFAARNPE